MQGAAGYLPMPTTGGTMGGNDVQLPSIMTTDTSPRLPAILPKPEPMSYTRPSESPRGYPIIMAEAPREQSLPPAREGGDDDWLEPALPDVDSGPEAAYLRAMVLETMALALEELPARQREVFIAHELDGRSFKELAAESGLSVNTLLGWKRLAVLHLRARLRPLYDEFSW